MIEDLGHRTFEARSGSQALEIIRREPGNIDLVITDYAMPGMTGLDLAGIIRDLNSALPIIIASGYADIAQGPASVHFPKLAKPFRQAELAVTMQVAINGTPTTSAEPRLVAPAQIGHLGPA